MSRKMNVYRISRMGSGEIIRDSWLACSEECAVRSAAKIVPDAIDELRAELLRPANYTGECSCGRDREDPSPEL